MKVSFLTLTIDRFELTKATWEQNLTNASQGYRDQIEVLACDNGSTDRRIVDYFSGIAKYHRVNSRNEGVGKAFNQLFLRSTGDVIAMVGGDLLNPPGWLEAAVNMLYSVQNMGIVGIDWGHSGVPPLTNQHGRKAHWLTPQLNRIFGTCVFHRSLIERLGFFHEGYDVYGIEDSDWNERVNLAGYHSCYLPNMKCRHLVHDVGEQSEYRQMKDRSLSNNLAIFSERAPKFKSGELSLVEPLPPLRDPA